jgi:hypothetical protein
MRVLIGFILAVTAATASIVAAQAQSAMPCGDRGKLITMLDAKYSEGLSGFGVTGQSQLVEVFVSDGGSFTIVITNSKGVSCVIAAGDSWEKISPAKRLTSS